MGLAARLSFQTGFLDYLTQIEDARVSALAEELAEDYSQAGSWETLRDPRAWRRLINRFVRHEPLEPAYLRATLGLIATVQREEFIIFI